MKRQLLLWHSKPRVGLGLQIFLILRVTLKDNGQQERLRQTQILHNRVVYMEILCVDSVDRGME